MQGESSKNALVHFYCRTAAYCALRKSKRLKISYDWRGMPVEFVRETCTAYGHYTVCDSTKLVMAYDGSGRRVSKTRMKKTAFDGPWYADLVTHYTGIGTEIRENMPGGTLKDVRVVVNMPVFFRVTLTRLKPRSYIEKDILRLSNGGAILPKQSFGASRQGLGRYGIEDADRMAEDGSAQTFEWFLKNHLGSTMLVYGTGGTSGGLKAAYDYRSFGEQVTLTESADKVTENFTGKEKDDEIALNYFGARYLDPTLGVWISVDPMRQFASPYLYVGNGMNPVNAIDPDGKAPYQIAVFVDILRAESEKPTLDSYRDFQAAAKWGREKFGEDFEIRIIWNQKEMLDFVKAGKYTAIIAHTLLDRKGNPEQGTLVNREKDYDQIDLYRLDFDLFEINSYAKVFGCYVGSWYDDFANIDLGSNKGPLSMGDAYQGAADYLKDKGKNR